MAISVRASGTWAVSTTQNVTVTIPTGYQAGDLGILVSVWRPFGTTATVNQSWNEIIDETPGSTTNGAGLGSSRVYVAYKVLASSETNPTLTRSTAITPEGSVIIVLQKGASDTWNTPAKIANSVEQAMGSTAMSHNLTTTAAIAIDDLIFALTGVADDSATFTRATTAISGGPSWGANVVEYPATHASSTTGNDMAADLIYRVPSSAVASGQTITVTATLSAAERVASVLFKVAVTQGAILGLIDAGSAIYGLTVMPDQFVTLGLIDQTASAAASHVQSLGTNYYDPASTSIIISPSSKTVTAGNTIVVAWGANAFGAVSGITDNLGNTYSFIEYSTGSLHRVELWYAPVTTGGSLTTITVSYSSSQYVVALAEEISGAAGSPSAAGGFFTSSSTTATWMASGTIPAGGLVIGCTINNNGRTLTAGSASGSPSTSITLLGKITIGSDYAATAYAKSASQVTSFVGTITLDLAAANSGAGGIFSPSGGGGGTGVFALTATKAPYPITLGLIDGASTIYAITVERVSAAPQNLALGLINSNGNYTGAVLALGPIAYWRLGESSGTTADDELNAHDGTYTNSPTLGATGLLPGDSNTAVVFDPAVSVQHITVPDHADFDCFEGTNPWSMVCWFDIDNSAGEGFLFSKQTSSNIVSLSADASSGYISIGRSNATNSDVLYVEATNGPHFVVATYDGKVTRLFIDGAEGRTMWDTNGDSVFSMGTISGSLFIGALTATTYGFKGKLDDPAIFNFVLTEVQIGNLYATASAGEVFSLKVGYAIVALGLIDSGSAIYSLTVVQDQFVTLGLVDAASAIYGLVLTPKNTLTVGLIDAGSAIYDLTLTPKNTLTVGLIDSVSAIYDLTVMPDQFVTLGFIDAGSAVYGLMLAPKNTLTVGLIDSVSAIYGMTVTTAPYPVVLGLIDAGSAIYGLTVAHGLLRVTLDLVDAGSAIYDLTVVRLGGVQTVVLGFTDAGSVIYDLTAVRAPYPVTLGLIDAGSVIYDLTAVRAPYPVTLGLIDAGSAIYDLTAAHGLLRVTLGLIDGQATLYSLSIGAPVQSVELDLISIGGSWIDDGWTEVGWTNSGAPYVYAVSIGLAAYLISLVLIDSGSAVYDLEVDPGFRLISLEIIDGNLAIYALAVQPDQFISLGLIDAGCIVYDLTVHRGQIVSLVLIDAGRAVYALTVAPRYNIVVLDLIDAGSAVYSISLMPSQDLVLGLIESVAAVYSLAYLGFYGPSVVVVLGLISSTPVVYRIYVKRKRTLAQMLAMDGLGISGPAAKPREYTRL